MVAVGVSLLLHGAAIFFLFGEATPPSRRYPLADIELVDVKNAVSRPAIAAPQPSMPPVPTPSVSSKPRLRPRRPELKTPSQAPHQASEVSGGNKISTSSVAGDASDERMGPDLAITAEKKEENAPPTALPQNLLPNAVSFSQWERLLGGVASEEREQYEQKRQETRRSRGAPVASSAQVRAAMSRRRSITKNARILFPKEGRDEAARYILRLHRKMSPSFNHYLSALDSLSEQLHSKIQKSPLKYNPFYVPPPESDRQATLRGPMSDLSLSTQVEFALPADGALEDLRMIRSSTNQAFDAAVLSTVIQSAPFSPPPKTVLSLNDRAYIQWTFSRDRKKNRPQSGRLLTLGPLLPDAPSVDAGPTDDP